MTGGSREVTPESRTPPDRKPGDDAVPEPQIQPARRPGDEARPGSKQSGEQICPRCGGSGRIAGAPCESCAGTGRITAIVGDA